MGKVKETMDAYYENEKLNAIEKGSRMSFKQALDILHQLRNVYEGVDKERADAFNIVFEFIDNQLHLLNVIDAHMKLKYASDLTKTV